MEAREIIRTIEESLSPQSGRQHRAWGVSPRIESPTTREPAKRAIAVQKPVKR
jgi:hypothetical protein